MIGWLREPLGRSRPCFKEERRFFFFAFFFLCFHGRSQRLKKKRLFIKFRRDGFESPSCLPFLPEFIASLELIGH